jgi:hypothetical protein
LWLDRVRIAKKDFYYRFIKEICHFQSRLQLSTLNLKVLAILIQQISRLQSLFCITPSLAILQALRTSMWLNRRKKSTWTGRTTCGIARRRLTPWTDWGAGEIGANRPVKNEKILLEDSAIHVPHLRNESYLRREN